MTSFAFFLILAAALLHAVWNSFVKATSDRLLSIGYINLGQFTCAILALPFVAVPEPAAWPWLLASVVIHQGYYYTLTTGYRFGDLGQIYPIARGTAPLLVAVGGWFFLEERPGDWALAAICLISFGVLILSLHRRTYAAGDHHGKAIFFGLLTGIAIAGYTIADGAGVRASETIFGYIAWLFLFESLPPIFYYSYRRGLPAWKAGWRNGGRLSLLGGFLSVLAYAAAIWAMAITPLASVSALRETSVIFATMIGIIFLGEKLSALRIAASLFVATGVIFLRFS